MATDMHPTTHELMALRDGEVDAARVEALALHLERCTRCQGAVEALGEPGELFGAWADEVIATEGLDVATDDLVERIYARVRAEEGTPESHGIAAVPSANGDPGRVATPSATGATAPVTATVRPIGSARKKNWRIVAVAGGIAAVAAAGALLFTAPADRGGHHPEMATHRTPERENPLRTMLAANDPTDPGGSEVLSVAGDGEHTSYSVLEVDGAREGTTVAVVWIEDEL